MTPRAEPGAAVRAEGETADAGERQRVERAVQREMDGLLAYFLRRVSPAEDAADLLAETLLVVWRRSADLPHDQTEARMWMYGVARRVLSTDRRGKERRTALLQRLRAELATGSADLPTRPDLAAVRAGLEQLSDLDQEIIRLVHWEGFTLQQAATILHRRQGTVRSRYHRARHRLRCMLA